MRSFPMLAFCCLAVVALLAASPPAAQAFSSGAATCGFPLAAFHGSGFSGTGGFAITALKDGVPTSEVLPGETVEITITSAVDYTGFLARANEGTFGGPLVAGFAVTSGDHKIETACATPGSGMTQTLNALRTGESLSWTAPESLAPGTEVVFTAFMVVDIAEWYGLNESIQATLTIAAPPTVPTLELWALVALFSLLLCASISRLRSA